jgi:hypothetical protein
MRSASSMLPRNVGSHELRLSDADAGVEDGVFPVGWNVMGIRLGFVEHRNRYSNPAILAVLSVGCMSALLLFITVG